MTPEKKTDYTSAGYTPSHVANYFIFIAKKDSKHLTLMQLLKLVYIGYAWSLAAYKKKLFDEPIEAWRYGPVVPSLYHEFKYRGTASIDRYSDIVEVNDGSIMSVTEPHIHDKDDLTVLYSVWEQYKDKTAFELSDILHQYHSPWHEVYEDGKNHLLKDDDIYERAYAKLTELQSQGKI